MKKIILTVAAAFAAITGAFAQDHQYNVGYALTVNDYISMSPSATVSTGASWNSAAGMTMGHVDLGEGTFTVNASRSWHARYSGTDWTRDDNASGGAPASATIAPSVPLGALWFVTSYSGPNTLGGNYYGATTNGFNVASDMGGYNKSFKMNGYIEPNFNYNMQGVYKTTITLVAALD